MNITNLKNVEIKVEDLVDFFYPIGSYYITEDDTFNPNDSWKGEWEVVEGKFLYSSSSGDRNGGSDEVTLSYDNLPPHTHTRGTMEIKGGLGVEDANKYCTGAFTCTTSYPGGCRNGDGDFDHAEFTASRTWTGETSSVGGVDGVAQPISILPSYQRIKAWRRTS